MIIKDNLSLQKCLPVNFFKKLDSRLSLTIYIILGTLAGALIGFLVGIRLLIPVLLSFHSYLLMIYLLKNGERKKAVLYMLLWAFVLGLIMTFACYLMPERSTALIIRGAEYKNEMLDWIRTGVGKEGTPSRFIPEHFLHLGVFIALSLLTMSSISILFGTIMMNYMAYYVAQLMLHTQYKLLVFLVGWHFWSLLRIAAFVILGVILAEFLTSKAFKYNLRLKSIKSYIITSIYLISLDIICKTIFAPIEGNYLKYIIFK